jgi:3-methyladenine DNA glycosylase AlkD
MTATKVLAELKSLGSEPIKKILLRHGASEPLYGVKVEDLKRLVKKLKPNHGLALELYASGVGDAMYLAALLCDPKEMTSAQLTTWAKNATSPVLSESAVPWVVAESRFAMPLALRWTDEKAPQVAACGWSTLSSYVAITADDDLDQAQLKALLDRVPKDIGKAPNRVKSCMNGFVISVASHVPLLTKYAQATAKTLGKVEVDVGDTACKVPVATDSIAKVLQAGRLGKKRKTAFC